MGKVMKPGEACARLIAWLGAFVFAFASVWEIIKITNSLFFVVCLCIFLAALYITGILDFIRFTQKIRGR